jgi:hypothetical protein
MKDVARAAGVSQPAVSYAYNRPDQLSAEVRKRVLRVASDLNYRLADSAKDRLLYCYAIPLYRQAADAGRRGRRPGADPVAGRPRRRDRDKLGEGSGVSPVARAGPAWCVWLGCTPARRQPPCLITSS